MKYKLVVRTIECTAQSDPAIKFDWHYIGVIDSDTPSQKTSHIMWGAIEPKYRMMCGAIDDFIHDRYAEAILRDIGEIERGDKEIWEEETEAYIFWLTREGVVFEFQYGDNGPKKGGEVTLEQFKLAVTTYLQFLRDPERRPLEVPFPE